MFLKHFWFDFLPLKTWKKHPKKLLIIGPFFFSVLPTSPNPAQILDIFHRNLPPRNFSIMTLVQAWGWKVRGWKVQGWKVQGWKVQGWNVLQPQKSRDARKVRENQLNLKVACLENANTVLRNKLQREMKKNQELINELETCQNENDELKQRFSLRKSKWN